MKEKWHSETPITLQERGARLGNTSMAMGTRTYDWQQTKAWKQGWRALIYNVWLNEAVDGRALNGKPTTTWFLISKVM